MSFFQVTSSELKNSASSLQGIISRYQGEIDNLSTAHTNLNSMWEGEAKEAFNTSFVRNLGIMNEFKTAIEQYIQALAIIAEKYEEAEKRNLSIAGTN